MSLNLLSNGSIISQSNIDWNELIAELTPFYNLSTNKLRLVQQPLLTEEELEKEFSYTEIFLALDDSQTQTIIQSLDKIQNDDNFLQHLAHLSKNGTLDLLDLHKVALLIEISLQMTQNIKQFSQIFFEPHLNELLLLKKNFLREFRWLVQENGDIDYDRHPELSKLKKDLLEIEQKIRNTIQAWITENDSCLQFASFDYFDSHIVVPVRSDSYRSTLGIIIDRSDTGHTLYVEPYLVRDLSMQRLKIISIQQEIIQTLCRKFSQTLFESHLTLNSLYSIVLLIDRYQAKARTAFTLNFHRPHIKINPGFEIRGLFHPLIKNAIRNDAVLDKDQNGIIISGPNTGGKTVFLKTITLIYLLRQMGYFVPAQSAELYPYQSLCYLGQDQQLLLQGLSSFSGEVKRFVELSANLSETNLILIDEIFHSTSSEEASALALALFETLHRKSFCHLVVSTHHQMLKTLVHQQRSYLSCHVGFDLNNLKPTYKIFWGSPGSSLAIQVFQLLSKGKDEFIPMIKMALSTLDHRQVTYESILAEVNQKQVHLDQLIVEQEKINKELKNQKGAMEGVLHLKMQEEMNRARNQIDKILNEARSMVEKARSGEITKTKRIEDSSSILKREVESLLPGYESNIVQNPKPNDPVHLSDLQIGQKLFCFDTKQDMTLVEIDHKRSQLVLAKNLMRIKVPLERVAISSQKFSSPQISVSIQKSREEKFEYDLRGYRLSEFQSIIDKALGDLLSGDIPFINIIHGHGDGILKNWLRDHLKKHPDFDWMLPENGNDGETKIILRTNR